MRFDKNQLQALAALPDDELWREVVKIASSFGYSLPEQTPSHNDLQKMRDAISGQKISITDAAKLLNQYKKMGRGLCVKKKILT